VLTVNGYGGRQTKENEKSWCFKGWETLVIEYILIILQMVICLLSVWHILLPILVLFLLFFLVYPLAFLKIIFMIFLKVHLRV